MSINRKNISTTSDGADIFAIGSADSPFTNLGNLGTSGNLASPIRGAANGISVINRGTLSTSGDGSPGVTIGDAFGTHYDNVTVSNFGNISTSGAVFDDGVTFAFADGIDTYGNNNKLVNYGSITATDPSSTGMVSIGANCELINYGKIEAAGAGLAVDQIEGTEINNSLINYGQIHTTGDGSHGILLLIGDNVVKNYGTIQADGFNSFGIAMEGDRNHGENYGTILVTGEIGRGVLLNGEDLTFDNYGTVRATGLNSIGLRFSGENLAGTDGGIFTNYGKVVSAARSVSGVDSDDHVINRGSLVGNVTLGAGDDSYLAGKGGSLQGTLTIGSGDDLITFEKGGGKLTVTDFVAGQGSDDMIDLSAFGYHSLSDVLSHASQQGSDVLLQLGGRDQIVLQNVSLGSLHADDFAFATDAAFVSSPLQPVSHDLFFG